MKLSEYPEEIKHYSEKLQKLIEERDYLLADKKAKDIAIEKVVQGFDPKIVKNENQRDIARFDLRDDLYLSLLGAIAEVESDIATLKINIQYLRDGFAVAKIENQGEIAAAYV